MSTVRVKNPVSFHSVKAPARLDAGDLSTHAHQLLVEQRDEWPMLRKDYASLPSVQTRSVRFDGFEITLQYNPARLISSAAKVDAKSIRDRRCFLCEDNLPREQRGVKFNGAYVILCNPFPIFPEHFTIPHKEHKRQEITGSMDVMLGLAKELSTRYTVFYNGPKCGASAPDHLHFQAGNKGYMPLDREYDFVKLREPILSSTQSLRVYAIQNYLRRFVSLESTNSDVLCRAFDIVHSSLQKITSSAEEPLLNILASFDAGVWRMIIFPRAKHRPDFYFAEGDAKILLSPATVEMGGVCALPVKKDYERMTKEHLIQAYDEVTLPGEQFAELKATIKPALAGI
jgi:ATP adenylyltransferase/5',5'''-P-1,P-4-tetraphosphate phosphorylase II